MEKIVKSLKRAGPAFITTSTVFGPASLLLAGVAGANYRYQCTWVLLFLFLERFLFLDIGTRVGVRLKDPYATTVRKRYSKILGCLAGIFTAIPVLIYTSGNALGTALAANLMFGGNTVVWALFFMALVIALFFLKNTYAVIEKLAIGFMVVMILSFAITLFITGISIGEFVRGFIPTLNPGALLTGLAIFLTSGSEQGVRHSYMVHEKGYTEEEATTTAKTDHVLSTVFMVLILGMIMSAAAEVLNPAGIVPTSAPEFARMLEPLAGSFAKYIFAIGLFGAAITSLIGAPTSAGLCFADAFGKLNAGMKTNIAKIISIATVLVMGLVAVIPVALGAPSLNVYWIASFATFIGMPLNGFFMLRLVNDDSFIGGLKLSKSRYIICWAVYIFVLAFTAYNYIRNFF